MSTTDYDFIKAAQLISHADGLLVTAGAGMGIDSGLPDFRGVQGFWTHYPALQAAGLSFEEIASPEHFESTPRLAWGFYGHRLQLYRQTQPHMGFQILRQIGSVLTHDAFVYTSNVDGQFQTSGVSDRQIYECHGSIHHLQCSAGCRHVVWPAAEFSPEVDETRCQLMNEPPVCPYCNAIARPNVLMFSDGIWIDTRATLQRDRLDAWLQEVKNPVVIELGAGTAIATVRYFGMRQNMPFIRINPRESALRPCSTHVSLNLGALEALRGIKQALADIGFLRNTA